MSVRLFNVFTYVFTYDRLRTIKRSQTRILTVFFENKNKRETGFEPFGKVHFSAWLTHFLILKCVHLCSLCVHLGSSELWNGIDDIHLLSQTFPVSMVMYLGAGDIGVSHLIFNQLYADVVIKKD